MNVLFVIRDMSLIEPLGVMFLSAVARREGHRGSLAIMNEEDVAARIGKERPDLVCLSVLSVDAAAFEQLAWVIRDRYPDLPMIVGGPHVTFERDGVRRWPVDAVVQGEGEWAFRDLLRALEAGEPINGIANVSTRAVVNPMRKLVEPLDELPHPDRALVYFPGGHLARLNVKSFMASRGCAYRCTYCFNSKYNELYRGNGTPVRRFSVDYLVEEIDEVRRDYGLDFVRFGDDVFAYRVDEWLLEFAEKYRRRIGLPFYCLVRPNLLKPDLVGVLRRAGCHSLSLSVESGSEPLRRNVLLRKMDDQTIVDAFRVVQAAGIHVYANAMVGLPGSTLDDEMQTLELMARCGPVYPSFTVFTPFRGTTLGEKCAADGLIDGQYPDRTTDRSILNCFTEQERNVQVNIVQLGIFAVRWPWLRKLILERLVYWRPNRLYFLAWYLMKNYVSARYIWPIRAGVAAKIRLAWRALAFELSGRLGRKPGRRRRTAAMRPDSWPRRPWRRQSGAGGETDSHLPGAAVAQPAEVA